MNENKKMRLVTSGVTRSPNKNGNANALDFAVRIWIDETNCRIRIIRANSFMYVLWMFHVVHYIVWHRTAACQPVDKHKIPTIRFIYINLILNDYTRQEYQVCSKKASALITMCNFTWIRRNGSWFGCASAKLCTEQHDSFRCCCCCWTV